jgi:hypothetical protein
MMGPRTTHQKIVHKVESAISPILPTNAALAATLAITAIAEIHRDKAVMLRTHLSVEESYVLSFNETKDPMLMQEKARREIHAV